MILSAMRDSKLVRSSPVLDQSHHYQRQLPLSISRQPSVIEIMEQTPTVQTVTLPPSPYHQAQPSSGGSTFKRELLNQSSDSDSALFLFSPTSSPLIKPRKSVENGNPLYLHQNSCSKTSVDVSSGRKDKSPSILSSTSLLGGVHRPKLRTVNSITAGGSIIARFDPVAVEAVSVDRSSAGGGGESSRKSLSKILSRKTLLTKRMIRLNQRSRLTLELKAAKTVAIVTGCFIFCWLGFSVTYAMQAWSECRTQRCVPQYLFDIFFWLGYINSALNPVIYAVFNKKFRRAFRNLLFCRTCRKQSFQTDLYTFNSQQDTRDVIKT